MTKSWLVPIWRDRQGTWELVGVGAAFPPTTAPTWPDRKPAAGGIILPGQDLNIVFGLTRTSARAGSSGTTTGPVIVYTENGNTYTIQEQTGLIVAARCL